MLEGIVLLAFIAALAGCVFTGASVLWALAGGYLIFCAYGLIRKHSLAELGKMSLSGVKTVRNILMIFGLIGFITALWRASGTIAVIVCWSSKLVSPSAFLLIAFLLNCMVSILTGTSFASLGMARGLAAIAPTYYVTGNHEWAVGGVPRLKGILTECGVTVLSNQYVTLERNGDSLVLAGVDDPNGYADQKTPEELAAEVYAACGDPFWILLAHRNNRFARQYSLLGADLVCSGHAHGGIVRLPGTDGLFSHDLDLFPSYTAGLYEENGSVLFVTRGLGNSGPSFRVFNRPEIAVLTLRRAEG